MNVYSKRLIDTTQKSFATSNIFKDLIKRTTFKIVIITFSKLLLYFEITDITHVSHFLWKLHLTSVPK